MTDYCLLQFLESVKGPTKKRGSNKAAASNTVDLPANNLKNIHHYVHGTWQHGYGQAWTKVRKLVKYLHPISDTLARVLYDMHFDGASDGEEVKQKGMKMSTFTSFTVCNIGDVPQQRDGTSCRIMTVKFIEHLSAGISLNKVDPSKITYYRRKLAIEALRVRHIYEELLYMKMQTSKLCWRGFIWRSSYFDTAIWYVAR
ncbi:unnamed protein product [Prunus armeniaca]